VDDINWQWLILITSIFDDIILLSASLSSLQTMLNRVFSTVCELNLDINCSESMCIAAGPHHKMNLPSMQIGCHFLMWSKCVKYLGVHFLSGSRIMCDVDLLLVNSSALETVYLPIPAVCPRYCSYIYNNLFVCQSCKYVNEVQKFNQQHIKALNVCWNSIFF